MKRIILLTLLTHLVLFSEDTQIRKSDLNSFESRFVNHIAYNFYNEAIDLLDDKDYKNAYDTAIKAKAIFDNTDHKIKDIELPYMPSFLRETSFSPKEIYYQYVEQEAYEINRLIKKIKLLSPPIPEVYIKRTSTYIEVSVENFGDLPLDDFQIFINEELRQTFKKIGVKQKASFKLDFNEKIDTVSFQELYGFAPHKIELY